MTRQAEPASTAGGFDLVAANRIVVVTIPPRNCGCSERYTRECQYGNTAPSSIFQDLLPFRCLPEPSGSGGGTSCASPYSIPPEERARYGQAHEGTK